MKFDIHNIKVDKNIPFEPRSLKGQHKWDPIFEALKEPGESTEIPADIKAAVAAAIIVRRKLGRPGTFRCALTGNGTARVWRIEDQTATNVRALQKKRG